MDNSRIRCDGSARSVAQARCLRYLVDFRSKRNCLSFHVSNQSGTRSKEGKEEFFKFFFATFCKDVWGLVKRSR
jgi:hypothetical protein